MLPVLAPGAPTRLRTQRQCLPKAPALRRHHWNRSQCTCHPCTAEATTSMSRCCNCAHGSTCWGEPLGIPSASPLFPGGFSRSSSCARNAPPKSRRCAHGSSGTPLGVPRDLPLFLAGYSCTRFGPQDRGIPGEHSRPRASSAPGGASEGGRDRGASGLGSDISEPRGDVSGEGAGAAGRQEGAGGGAELVAKLKACGIAGVIAYGILNTVYYLSAFLIMV